MRILLVLSCICAALAENYDVTTIYRLKEYPLEEKATEKGLVAKPSDCFTGTGSNTCDGWTHTGWTETDGGLFRVTFPNTVVQRFSAAANNATAKIKIPSKFINGIYVLDIAAKPSLDNNVLIIFSTEENDAESHLVLLEISETQSAEAHLCLMGQEGRQVVLPGGTQRMCATIPNQTRKPCYRYSGDNYRIHLGPSRLTVSCPNAEAMPFLTLDHLSQLKNLKYISVAAEGVVFSTPSMAMHLTDMAGSLVSPPMTHANTPQICVTFSAFMDPRSDASLTLYAQYSDGQRLDIGLVTASRNDSRAPGGHEHEEVKSKLWKFVKFVDPSQKGKYTIHIEGYKLSDYPVLISEISFCKQDVLVEVHARTNARGMPFVLHNETFIEPNVGITLPPFRAGDKMHGWTTDNWTWDMSDISGTAPLDFGLATFQEWTSGSNVTETFHFAHVAAFLFEPNGFERRSYESSMQILLYDENVENISPVYVIRLHNTNGYGSVKSANILKCMKNSQQVYSMHSNLNIQCDEVFSSQVFSSYQWYNQVTERNYILLTATQGRITVKVDNTLIIDWSDPEPVEVNQFSFSTLYMAGKFTGQPYVLTLSEQSGSMVSPPQVFTTSEICIALDYYSEEGDTVAVTAHVSLNGLDLVVGTAKLQSTTQYEPVENESKGWKHDLFVVTIPDEYANRLGHVVVTVTKGEDKDSTVMIQRIAGCNAEALEEDVHVFPESSNLAISSPGFDVSAVRRSHISHFLRPYSKPCYYGGKAYDGGKKCACPPGFTGENCEKGCGENRYGADCGGQCSASKRQCRGMLLCTPLLGCACAPGLTGPLCDTPCPAGSFGVGCVQRCGNCLSSTPPGGSCDRFTGKCHQGCKPGYYPPFCDREYESLIAAPTVENTGNTVNVSFDLEDLVVHSTAGFPQYYQVQYRFTGEPEWTHLTPTKIVVKEKAKLVYSSQIVGLKPGREYQVRAVLIAQDGGSYQGEDIPVAHIHTTCTVPDKLDFDFHSVNVTEESFGVMWKDPFSWGPWCPVSKYELHLQMGWLWLRSEHDATSLQETFSPLLPNNKYQIKLRAFTALGPTGFSQLLSVKTLQAAVPDEVLDLETKPSPSDATKLLVTWNPPANEGETSLHQYKVTYKCIQLLACPEADCSSSAGEVEVWTTSAVLGELLPFARYNITVAAISTSVGRTTSVLGATDAAVPSVAPVFANKAVLHRTNSSFSVRWDPPSTCVGINGYLVGYRYRLLSLNHSRPMVEGETGTASPTVKFTDLDPHSLYEVKVYAVTSSGWNTNHPLTFSVVTRATTPAVVEDLTVYKRGRRMLGLRWSKPRLTYGSLRSFTVTHQAEGESDVIKKTVDAKHCTAWPEMFCHTIGQLEPDKEYTISVQARNREVDEDGDEVTVIGVTKESAPGVPSSLTVVDKTSSSVTIQWQLPELINGQLRTFLISVEETDHVNSSDCCQDFPLKEVVVKSEELKYNFQLTGLRPASTYMVSVSGKTVSLGASATLTAHTRPPTPLVEASPRVTANSGGASGTWTSGEVMSVRLEPVRQYRDMTSGYMLLLASNETKSASLDIYDTWLASELNKFNETLYFVAEFTTDELASGKTFELTGNESPRKGRFGALSFPTPSTATLYQLVQVTILDYCGTLSMGYTRGDSFTSV